MPDPQDTPMCLSVKPLKQLRLERAKAIIQRCPEQTRSEVARRMAETMCVTLSTAYSYLRELAREYAETSNKTTNE
jgi:hypothetical protein